MTLERHVFLDLPGSHVTVSGNSSPMSSKVFNEKIQYNKVQLKKKLFKML